MLWRLSASRAAGCLYATITLSLGACVAREGWKTGAAETTLVVLVHLLSAVLFVIRRNPRPAPVRLRPLGVVILSLSYPYLFELDTSHASAVWRHLGTGLALLATAGCLAATAALGRCYGIVPADRGLTDRGPYRWIRHPIYASYLLVDASIVLSCPSVRNLVVTVLAVVLFTWRVGEEERVLDGPGYRAYARRVRFRLFPLVY